MRCLSTSLDLLRAHTLGAQVRRSLGQSLLILTRLSPPSLLLEEGETRGRMKHYKSYKRIELLGACAPRGQEADALAFCRRLPLVLPLLPLLLLLPPPAAAASCFCCCWSSAGLMRCGWKTYTL